MGNAFASAGSARGTRVGLENVRERRYRDAQDALAAKERERRHEREDFDFERAQTRAGREDTTWDQSQEDRTHAIDRRGVAESREDTLWQQGQEDRTYQTGRRAIADERADELYQQGQEDRSHAIERRGVDEMRGDTAWNQQQSDRQRMMAQAEQEGLQHLAQALQNGADPNLALKQFNNSGDWRIDPSQFRFDRNSGRLSFVDSDGDRFDGSLQEFASAVGLVPAADQDLIATDKPIYDPNTKEWIQPPGGQGGGRDTSPYNPETVQKNIESAIARSRGASFDVLGNWSIADTGDRQVVDYMISLAHDMEGRLRQQVSSGQVPYGEIVDAVTAAAKGMPTESQLAQRAEEWRTKGRNKTPEEAQAWLETERAKVRAEVEGELARAEQRILGRSGGAQQQSEPVSLTPGETVIDGYRYKGGDPALESSWEKV